MGEIGLEYVIEHLRAIADGHEKTAPEWAGFCRRPDIALEKIAKAASCRRAVAILEAAEMSSKAPGNDTPCCENCGTTTDGELTGGFRCRAESGTGVKCKSWKPLAESPTAAESGDAHG